MKATKQELKRCPFCGKNCLSPDGLYVRHSCYTIDAVAPTIDIWNNAYCWKEIDSNNKKIEALLEALKNTSESFHVVNRHSMDYPCCKSPICSDARKAISQAEAQ